MRRLLVWGLLALAVAACQPSPVPQDGMDLRAGKPIKMDRPTARLVSFASTGGHARATDSLQITATFAVPTAADQYGPVDSVRADVLGGYPSLTVVRNLAATATSLTVNLPLNLSGAGSAGPATVDGRVCLTTFRRNVPGPQVCRDSPAVSVTFPAPPGVTGLTVGAVIRAYP